MPAKKTETIETNEQQNKNVRFYSKFMTTPKEAQKAFNNGTFSGTDINPMYRIQILTEVFGPAGFGWWTQNVRYDMVNAEQTNEVSVFCELELVVKDPETGEVSQPIYGIGGNTYIKNWGNNRVKASDEAKKMAYTDALGIACKALGIGHDIWYANDRTKYTMYDTSNAPQPQSKTETKPAPAAKPTGNTSAPAQPVATQHTADSATLIAEIDDKLAVITKDMDQAAKRKLAEETIKPIIGVMNYKTCTDIEKLTKLRDTLNAA